MTAVALLEWSKVPQIINCHARHGMILRALSPQVARHFLLNTTVKGDEIPQEVNALDGALPLQERLAISNRSACRVRLAT